MNQTTAFVISLFLAGLSLTGCAAWSTYPAIPGAMQVGHPEVEPLPTIMAEAIRYCNGRFLKAEEPAFNLPEGVTVHTYEAVRRRLDAGRPMTEAGELAVHVRQVRVRGTSAQVDVVYPRGDGMHQFMTLHMKQRWVNRFEVEQTRLWRIHVQVPEPQYPLFEQEELEELEAVATAPVGD